MHLVAQVTASGSVSMALSPGEQGRDWRRRWAEAQRGLDAIAKPLAEPLSGDSVHAALHRLQAFFVQTYHLKDALKEDASSTGVLPATVESAISRDPNLALLADLANLDKHRRLAKPPRSGDTPAFGGLSGSTAGCPPGTWRLDVSIFHAGTIRDGLDVATSVLEAWRKTLAAWGLL